MFWPETWRPRQTPNTTINSKPARCAAILLLAAILASDPLIAGSNGRGVQASPVPLPLPLQLAKRTDSSPLYLGQDETSSDRSSPQASEGQVVAVRGAEVDEMEDGTDAQHGRRKNKSRSRRAPQLEARQILSPPTTHPLTFVPGAFTRDAAAAACGPGKQLAAVDVSPG